MLEATVKHSHEVNTIKVWVAVKQTHNHCFCDEHIAVIFITTVYASTLADYQQGINGGFAKRGFSYVACREHLTCRHR